MAKPDSDAGASTASQDQHAADQNREFFGHDDRYARRAAKLAITRNIGRAVNRELAGSKRVLDIGNGGVFDYDTSLADEIVAVDLFLDEVPPDRFPPNVTARSGDALALGEPDASFDTTVIVALLHHLVGETPDDLVANADRAVAEATRVLRPGGRLVLVESCVPEWFYRFERRAFGLLRRITRTRMMDHPPTLQLPRQRVAEMMERRLEDVRVERIPSGPVVLQFGVPWPAILTPARAWLFVGTRALGAPG
jgi:SAM-dependent methyltransferase